MGTAYIVGLFGILIIYGPLAWGLYRLSKAEASS